MNANHAWWFPEFDTASHGFELVGINVVNDPYGQDTVGGCATMRSTPTIVYKATAENFPVRQSGSVRSEWRRMYP